MGSTMRRLFHGAQAPSQTSDAPDFATWLRDDLISECRRNGLPTRGRKAELVNRLVRFHGRAAGALARRTSSMDTTVHDKGSAGAATSGRAPSDPQGSNPARGTEKALSTDIHISKATDDTSRDDSAKHDLPALQNDAVEDCSHAKPHRESEGTLSIPEVHNFQEEQAENAQREEVVKEQRHAVSSAKQPEQSQSDAVNQYEHVLPPSEQMRDNEKPHSRPSSPHPVEDINPKKGSSTLAAQEVTAELQTNQPMDRESVKKLDEHQNSMHIEHGQSAPGKANADATKTHPALPSEQYTSEELIYSQSPGLNADEGGLKSQVVATEATGMADTVDVEMKDANKTSTEQLRLSPTKNTVEHGAAHKDGLGGNTFQTGLERDGPKAMDGVQDETNSAIQICARVNDSGAIQFEPAQELASQNPVDGRESEDLRVREEENQRHNHAPLLNVDADGKNPTEPMDSCSRELAQQSAEQGETTQIEPDFMRIDEPAQAGGSSPWQSSPKEDQAVETFARWKRPIAGKEEEVARTPDVIDLDADSEGNDYDEEVDSDRSNSESIQDSVDESQSHERGEAVIETREEPTPQTEEVEEAKLNSDEDIDEDEDEDEYGDEGISIDKKLSSQDESELNQEAVRGPQDVESALNEQDGVRQRVHVSRENRNDTRRKPDYTDEDEDDTKNKKNLGERRLSGFERSLVETENDKIGSERLPVSMDVEVIDLQEDSRMADEDEDEEEKEEEEVAEESEDGELSDAERDERSSEPLTIDGRQHAPPPNDGTSPELILKVSPSSDSPQRESEEDEEMNQTGRQTTEDKGVVADSEVDEMQTEKLELSEDEANENDSSKSLDRTKQETLSNDEDYSSGSASAEEHGTVAKKGLIKVASKRLRTSYKQSPSHTPEQVDANKLIGEDGPQKAQEQSSDEHKRSWPITDRGEDSQVADGAYSRDSNEIVEFSESPLPSPRSFKASVEAGKDKSLQNECPHPSASEVLDEPKVELTSRGSESRHFENAELPSSNSGLQKQSISIPEKTYTKLEVDSPRRNRANEEYVTLAGHESPSFGRNPEIGFQQSKVVDEPTPEVSGMNMTSRHREMGVEVQPSDQAEVVHSSSSEVEEEKPSPAQCRSNSNRHESMRNLTQMEEYAPTETENRALEVVQGRSSQSHQQDYPTQPQEAARSLAEPVASPSTELVLEKEKVAPAAGLPSLSRQVSQSAKRDFNFRTQDLLQLQHTKPVSNSDSKQAKLVLSGDVSDQKSVLGRVMPRTQRPTGLEDVEHVQTNRQSVQNFTSDLFSIVKAGNHYASRNGVENMNRSHENGSVPSLQSSGSKRRPLDRDGNVANQSERPQKIRRTSGLVKFCPMPTPDSTIREFASALNHRRHQNEIPEGGQGMSANLERLRRLEEKHKNPAMSSFKLPPLSFASGRIYTQQQYQDQALVFHPGSVFLETDMQPRKAAKHSFGIIPRPDKEKFIKESRQRLEAHRLKARSRQSVKSPFLNGNGLHPLRSNAPSSRPSTSLPAEGFRHVGSHSNKARKRVTFNDSTDPGTKRRRRL